MDGWVNIFAGPMWEVDLKKARLEAEGIRAFVPDAATKLIDPFVTGANPLMTQLWVSVEDADVAQEVISLRVEPLAAPAGARAPAADDAGDDESTWTQDEIESLARRTRWSALMTFTWPLALFYGWLYAVASRESGLRAGAHALTLFCIVLGVVSMAATGVLFWVIATQN